ncbi:ParB/RepB/Spo0J family partition protein [Sedimentibacter sp. zth1]|uniref:ParB/RepB/Spo0J family partition protein n=1 Tax=Sedimentibacter sp. zth1 TaxID=2816908 RepID=UPI001A90CCF8|nr:ParB/RepB/Spo0J family partition protein [Sedimentibacter sp. zth1]QSX05190.1 ParB/RepB/Spo0J family partition protein [Sedimentibacter sp. zth1]
MANARKALGRGLSALIPDNLEDEDLNKVREIDIDLIVPNPNQPRKSFEPIKLKELSESIKKYGMIQPIIVKKEDSVYTIIAGERRWRASKIANLKTIPCIIRDIENKNASEIALIENIQREDLNPIDEATAYEYIMNRYAITQEELAEIVGKSRVYVTNTLRLLNLDSYAKEKIISNEITQGHARAILSLEKSVQKKLVDDIIENGLSVRDVEKIVRNMKSNKVKKIVKKDKYILNIEESLTNKFAVKVKVINNKNKGKIQLEYKNLNELNRLLDIFNINE